MTRIERFCRAVIWLAAAFTVSCVALTMGAGIVLLALVLVA
jgi:hypothetical protein